ncbi:unnamed protein product [Somion occarium]|uniref:Extracellular membrane protein CFEM domain-containing protein n=1 Tax=Somion occarium TaxID=3059160 RepID=A0ABP1CQR5_9APHY
MQLLAFLAVFSVLFAGKVLALSITFPGGSLSNLPPSQFFNFNDPDVMNTCQKDCAPAIDAIRNCGDTDDACLCSSNATIPAITSCHQCVFGDLIHKRKLASDPREDSTPALTAYQTSCLSSPINGTLLDASRPAPDTFKSYKALFAITVPPDWDGPFGQGLSMAATVITVIAGAGLGAGMIGVLISM